jgi:hypothetical protein
MIGAFLRRQWCWRCVIRIADRTGEEHAPALPVQAEQLADCADVREAGGGSAMTEMPGEAKLDCEGLFRVGTCTTVPLFPRWYPLFEKC